MDYENEIVQPCKYLRYKQKQKLNNIFALRKLHNNFIFADCGKYTGRYFYYDPNNFHIWELIVSNGFYILKKPDQNIIDHISDINNLDMVFSLTQENTRYI
jgi:hypothetical protein